MLVNADGLRHREGEFRVVSLCVPEFVQHSIIWHRRNAELKRMTRPATEPQAQSTSNVGSPSPGRPTAQRSARSSFEVWAPPVLVALALVARFLPAWRFFLNPDEALHNLLASQTSLGMAYKAALTAAHPPLFILLLYYWRWLGQAEWVLRMPSVVAGTACCWLVYRWLRLLRDRVTAFIGLLLFSFAPTLIWLSAEVRQYALLLLFMTAALYAAEVALAEYSPSRMILFSLSLYGALLTHYSALIFALVIGVYMLARLYPFGTNLRLLGIWAAGQVGGAAIAGYYLLTHVTHLKDVGMIRGVSETYVRKSLYRPGDAHLASFIALQTLRFFTYLFSHGVVGSLALVLFVAGLAFLLKGKAAGNGRVAPRKLALLLALPFLVECGTALAGIYPYGGTRHCILLAPFAVAGVSIGLSALSPARFWTKSSLIAATLAVCNVFPSPPPMIRPRNQSRTLMAHAVAALRQSAAPGSLILADYQSGLLLGYYLCGHGIVQEFPPYVSFAKAGCGPYAVFTARPERWKFHAGEFPDQLAELTANYGLAPDTKIWLFNTGWITDSAPALEKAECPSPRNFGENIVFCELTVGVRHTP